LYRTTQQTVFRILRPFFVFDIPPSVLSLASHKSAICYFIAVDQSISDEVTENEITVIDVSAARNATKRWRANFVFCFFITLTWAQCRLSQV